MLRTETHTWASCPGLLPQAGPLRGSTLQGSCLVPGGVFPVKKKKPDENTTQEKTFHCWSQGHLKNPKSPETHARSSWGVPTSSKMPSPSWTKARDRREGKIYRSTGGQEQNGGRVRPQAQVCPAPGTKHTLDSALCHNSVNKCQRGSERMFIMKRFPSMGLL